MNDSNNACGLDGVFLLLLFRLWCWHLQVATSKMNLSEECDLEDYINRSERVSAADIAAICAEAGLHAVRANRYAAVAN